VTSICVDEYCVGEYCVGEYCSIHTEEVHCFDVMPTNTSMFKLLLSNDIWAPRKINERFLI